MTIADFDIRLFDNLPRTRLSKTLRREVTKKFQVTFEKYRKTEHAISRWTILGLSDFVGTTGFETR